MTLLLSNLLHSTTTSMHAQISSSPSYSPTPSRLCSSLNVTDQIPHPHKTKGKIIIMHVYLNTINLFFYFNTKQVTQLDTLRLGTNRASTTIASIYSPYLLQIVYTAATQTDFMRIVAKNDFTPFYCK